MVVQAWLGFAFLSLLLHGEKASKSRVFTSPVAVFRGSIRYGFYLWNVPFLNVVIAGRFSFPAAVISHAVEFGLLLAILVTPLTILLSVWSMRFVERPGIRAGAWASRQILGFRGAVTFRP